MGRLMSSILVTGGAGFIGTNLCNELRSRGHDVIACDLLNNERDSYMRCDVRNYRQIESLFEHYGTFDLVINTLIFYFVKGDSNSKKKGSIFSRIMYE